MKKALNLIATSFLAIAMFSCKTKPLAEIQSEGDQQFVTISLNNQERNPFSLKAGDNGALWYKTEQGIFPIKGKPIKQENNAEKMLAVWDMNGKELTLEIIKKAEDYHFSMTALPDDDILGMGMNVKALPDEYFTGLFERTVDGVQTESWKEGISTTLNLRGETVDMIIKPTMSLYTPFFLSSNGYGLFFEGTWPGHYDFCKANSEQVQISFEGKSLSGTIYTSNHPAEIVQRHSLNVGPTIVPPEWAFLPWRWRDNHSNLKTFFDGTSANVPYNSMLVEDILMMKAFDIPCGVYWVDRPWAKGLHGYADFEWNEEQFPHAKEMIDWLHSNDIKFLLWAAPWITGEMRFEAKEKGYNIALKGPHDDMSEETVALMDFTNPDACKWLQEKGIEKMLNQGVDGFKLDRSEEMVPENDTIIYFNGKTAREVRNEYPVLYVKTFNEACRKIKGDDFVLIPRAGYTGSSKYSGFWGGDIGSPAEGLRAAIVAIQRCAIMGFPIWGSDIGGYWQGNLDREVFARWLAFGCFNPIMEVGPTEDRAPWFMKSEPSYDTELIAIWRMYAKIHEMLAEYSFNLAKEANVTGMPIVRPLFLECPNEKDAWNDWQTFLYGPDILVSAIWKKGTTKQRCYLPSGDNWINAWNPSEVYSGGDFVEIETPLERIPIFIREGSSIDLGDLGSLYVESTILANQVPNLSESQKEVK